MMKLQFVFTPDKYFPSIAIPIFSDEKGNLFYQSSIDGEKITEFIRTPKPNSDQLKFKDIGYELKEVGDDILYCIALTDNWLWLGDKERLQADIKQNSYKGALENSPFLQIEIGYLLSNKEMIYEGAKKGVKKLLKTSPAVARSWRETSLFEDDINQEIDKILSYEYIVDTELYPVRISLPEIAMRSIDLVAKDSGNNRSLTIRLYMEIYREKIMTQEFWDKFLETVETVRDSHLVGRRFGSDQAFRDYISREVKTNKNYISRDLFKIISSRFEFKRATVRLHEQDIPFLQDQWEKIQPRGLFRGNEEFIGMFVLHLMLVFEDNFEGKLLSIRDRVFNEVVDRIKSDVK